MLPFSFLELIGQLVEHSANRTQRIARKSSGGVVLKISNKPERAFQLPNRSGQFLPDGPAATEFLGGSLGENHVQPHGLCAVQWFMQFRQCIAQAGAIGPQFPRHRLAHHQRMVIQQP